MSGFAFTARDRRRELIGTGLVSKKKGAIGAGITDVKFVLLDRWFTKP